MNRKQLMAGWLILLMFLSGCASWNERLIKTKASRINLINGVSKGEAVVLAQNALLKSGYHKENYLVTKPFVSYNGDSKVWEVSFESKKDIDDYCHFGCLINKVTTEMYCGCLAGYR